MPTRDKFLPFKFKEKYCQIPELSLHHGNKTTTEFMLCSYMSLFMAVFYDKESCLRIVKERVNALNVFFVPTTNEILYS